jgi:predicted kinase
MLNDIPTVHMICGFIGAGKTTLARNLERETGGVRFTIEEWTLALQGMSVSLEEQMLSQQRCKRMIWSITQKLLPSCSDVILDFGFWRDDERALWRERIEQAGARPRVYYLEAALPVLRRNLAKRNAHLPLGGFEIDEATFDELAPKFQPPGNAVDCMVYHRHG